MLIFTPAPKGLFLIIEDEGRIVETKKNTAAEYDTSCQPVQNLSGK